MAGDDEKKLPHWTRFCLRIENDLDDCIYYFGLTNF
jgi:hypothetical protein